MCPLKQSTAVAGAGGEEGELDLVEDLLSMPFSKKDFNEEFH